MKKLISVIIVALLILTSLTAMASAEETSGKCGDNVTWSFDGSSGTLTISGTGRMDDYRNYNSAPWYESYRESIIRAVVGEGVNTIAGYSFIDCINLETVEIADSVESIGDAAFVACEKLKTVDLPERLYKIGDGVFAGCASLQSITVDENNKTFVSDENGILCTKDSDNNKIKIICCPAGNGLTEYVMPDTIEKIMDRAFYECKDLVSVEFGQNVTYIDDMAFGNCTALKKVVLSPYTTDIYEVFKGCTALENVTIPEGVTSLYETFHSCSSLKNISLPKSLEKINGFSFWRCSDLENIYYAGSEDDWNNIEIEDLEDSNKAISKAKIHFNSDVDAASFTTDEDIEKAKDGKTEDKSGPGIGIIILLALPVLFLVAIAVIVALIVNKKRKGI